MFYAKQILSENGNQVQPFFGQIDKKIEDHQRAVQDGETIRWLAELSLLEYGRQRVEAASQLGVGVRVLDEAVKSYKAENNKKGIQLYRNIEPYPNPVNAAKMLDDIVGLVKETIVCDKYTADAAALWVTFTWLIDYVEVAPLAIITAPEKRCGKSTFLTLLSRLVRRPILSSNIKGAALFRFIERDSPTLLIDETDTFLNEDNELRGIINSGHTRDTAYTARCVSNSRKNFEPSLFSTWSAKALSGIGKLSETLMDRAIVFRLRRKRKDEKTTRLRQVPFGRFDLLQRKLARFAEDHGYDIGKTLPNLPDELNDRQQDNWEPLLAIAEFAGGHWPETARKAAIALSADGDDAKSVNVELLECIREILETGRWEKIPFNKLLNALLEDDEAPWATYNKGKPLAPRQLSKRLKEFGISTVSIRLAGQNQTTRVYTRSQFDDVFKRYLSETIDEDGYSEVVQFIDSKDKNNDSDVCLHGNNSTDKLNTNGKLLASHLQANDVNRLSSWIQFYNKNRNLRLTDDRIVSMAEELLSACSTVEAAHKAFTATRLAELERQALDTEPDGLTSEDTEKLFTQARQMNTNSGDVYEGDELDIIVESIAAQYSDFGEAIGEFRRMLEGHNTPPDGR